MWDKIVLIIEVSLTMINNTILQIVIFLSSIIIIVS